MSTQYKGVQQGGIDGVEIGGHDVLETWLMLATKVELL